VVLICFNQSKLELVCAAVETGVQNKNKSESRGAKMRHAGAGCPVPGFPLATAVLSAIAINFNFLLVFPSSLKIGKIHYEKSN